MRKEFLLFHPHENNEGTGELVSCSQTSFLAQGVIACSISARTKKGLVWFTVLNRSKGRHRSLGRLAYVRDYRDLNTFYFKH